MFPYKNMDLICIQRDTENFSTQSKSDLKIVLMFGHLMIKVWEVGCAELFSTLLYYLCIIIFSLHI